jgi:hypothetical protein
VNVNQGKREAMKIGFKIVVFAFPLMFMLAADVMDQTSQKMTLVREAQAGGWGNR